MILLALNFALAAAVGLSFLRPIGALYVRKHTYPGVRFADGTGYSEFIVGYYDGLAFHDGGLVFFEFLTYHDSRDIKGLRIVRIDHDNMRSEILCAMDPIDGYSAATLGAKVGVDYPLWGSRRILVVPAWLVLLIFGMPLGRRLVHVYLKFRRARKGCCGRCGYDMRGSGSRCPECGAAIVEEAEMRSPV